MLVSLQNNLKITANILGGLDYFVSKQASKHYYIIISTREATRALFTPHPPV